MLNSLPPSPTIGGMAQTDLSKVISVLELIRQHYPKIPSQTLSIFLRVCEKGRVTLPDLKNSVGISQPAISRNVDILSNTVLDRSTGERGIGLVEKYDSPEDRRITVVELTPKGKRIHETMLRLLR